MKKECLKQLRITLDCSLYHKLTKEVITTAEPFGIAINIGNIDNKELLEIGFEEIKYSINKAIKELKRKNKSFFKKEE